MKKIVILLFVSVAFLSFSCNKYCHCTQEIDGVKDKNFEGRFVNENGNCQDYELDKILDDVHYVVKCK